MAMLEQLYRQLELKDRARNTFVNLEQILGKAEKTIGKPLEELTWEELLDYFNSLKKAEMATSSIFLVQSKFIRFYKFCLDETEDIKYSSMIRKIKKYKVDKPKKHIAPSDLLTPEDVQRLINVATLERDRCIIASLWESGMRIGELCALSNSKVLMDEKTQEVTFIIPNIEGCKTGGRTIVCTEIYGYVQNWAKCNPSSVFITMSQNGIRRMIERLFRKAGIEKPNNVHIFRHSAITHWVDIEMQPNEVSMRAWGIPNSNMLSTYISLSNQSQANAYKNAKGLNGNGTKVINPIARLCVKCGRLVQSGDLCPQCLEIKRLTEKLQQNDAIIAAILEEMKNPTGNVLTDGKQIVINKG